MKRILLGLVLLLTLGAGTLAPTCILDRAAAERQRHNKGVALHWIDWDRRGSAAVSVADGRWILHAAHAELAPGAACRQSCIFPGEVLSRFGTKGARDSVCDHLNCS